MPSQLKGKVAIVTGGRGGIGRSICQRFSKEGAIVIAADLTRGEGDLPANVGFELLDVTDVDNIKTLMEKIHSEHGKLDIVINTAAIEIEKTIEDTSLEQWNRSEEHTSELQSQAYLVCRLLLEKKKKQNSTRLNSSSQHRTVACLIC